MGAPERLPLASTCPETSSHDGVWRVDPNYSVVSSWPQHSALLSHPPQSATITCMDIPGAERIEATRAKQTGKPKLAPNPREAGERMVFLHGYTFCFEYNRIGLYHRGLIILIKLIIGLFAGMPVTKMNGMRYTIITPVIKVYQIK